MTSNQSIPKYLTDYFNRIAHNEGFIDHSILQNNAPNYGFMGELLHVTLSGNRKINDGNIKADTVSLTCKLLPSNEVRQQKFSNKILFQREVYFYNTIVPIFTKLQKDRGLTEQNGFFAFPKCYAAIYEPEKDQYAIIMEDLKVMDFTMWDKSKPIDFESVKLMMITLGRLHALSFVIRDQQPDVFREFQKLTDVWLQMVKQKVMRLMFNSTFDLAVATLPKDSDVAVYQRIRDTWLDIWDSCLDKGVAEPFSCIGHGDCWSNNVMFRLENGITKEIRILDWQMARLGSPALDISHFLLTSTNKPLRDNHFDSLLQSYYDSLSATIKVCGSIPENLFTFDDLQNQLRKFGKYGLTISPLITQVLVSEPRNMVDLDVYSVEIENTDETKFLITFDDRSRAEYIEKLSGVISDAIKFGWDNQS